MDHRKRVDKMLETVRPMVDLRRKAKRTSRLKGADLAIILEAVEQAVAEADRPILEEMVFQVEEYGEARPGEHHGFLEWLLLLQDGVAALPDRLPLSVLIAWRDRYVSQWDGLGRPWTPRPFWRCEDCLMVLPHGEGGWADPCPVSGSSRVWHSDFSKPVGANWIDPHAVRRGGD